jgi:hypothetical protein
VCEEAGESKMTDWLSLENVDFSDEPVEGNPNVGGKWATFGTQQIVGNGSIANDKCGTFSTHYGCLRGDLHEGAKLNGEDCSGKGFFRVVSNSCHRPSCPLCYESWAGREAHKIEGRLLEAEKQYGKIEHFIASVPLERYGLSFDVIRKLVLKALASRGIFGGCTIFHGFRWNKWRKLWYWSPHLHVLAFLKGGYARCRACNDRKCEGRSKEFLRCDGFEARTRREFETDGFIVKVAEDRYGAKGERKSVFDTAQYQLSHASIDVNSKRAHAVFWFGVVSYRRFHFKVEKRRVLCPICESELKRVHFVGVVGLENFGHQCFVTNRRSPLFKREFLSDLIDCRGRPLWVEAPKVVFRGSGSYEGVGLGE